MDSKAVDRALDRAIYELSWRRAQFSPSAPGYSERKERAELARHIRTLTQLQGSLRALPMFQEADDAPPAG